MGSAAARNSWLKLNSAPDSRPHFTPAIQSRIERVPVQQLIALQHPRRSPDQPLRDAGVESTLDDSERAFLEALDWRGEKVEEGDLLVIQAVSIPEGRRQALTVRPPGLEVDEVGSRDL